MRSENELGTSCAVNICRKYFKSDSNKRTRSLIIPLSTSWLVSSHSPSTHHARWSAAVYWAVTLLTSTLFTERNLYLISPFTQMNLTSGHQEKLMKKKCNFLLVKSVPRLFDRIIKTIGQSQWPRCPWGNGEIKWNFLLVKSVLCKLNTDIYCAVMVLTSIEWSHCWYLIHYLNILFLINYWQLSWNPGFLCK